MRSTTAGTEVSKVVVRPVMAVEMRPMMPVVAWRTKTARATAPRMSENRTRRRVPEGPRPDLYWVVMLVSMRSLEFCAVYGGGYPPIARV